MREFVVDLTTASTFDEFVARFNSGFCRHCGGHWHGRSWDAFNDYLSWPDDEAFTLQFRGWDRCDGLNEDDRRIICELLKENPHVNAVFA